MAEQIYKLSPDRDLQCYFLTPSAIAALSQSSPTGFTVSGKWRQQFDWAVVEWNRDNTFEHPALRNLPDGDLSGLVLSYCESRTGCIPIQSNLVPVVDWDNLRIWATPGGSATETIYHVPLAALATPTVGSYVPASATMTLAAIPAAGQRVGLALLETHFYAVVQSGNQLSDVAAAIAANINALSQTFSATSTGPSVTVTWNATAGGAPYANLLGANGNRITVYGFAEGGATAWQAPSATFSGGAFPSEYQITIDFGALKSQGIPTDNVRKLRWTWAADLQTGSFQQTEFEVSISQWTVTGNNRGYMVAGPGSRRIEDTDSSAVYNGSSWAIDTGNYSGSKIHYTSNPGDSLSITYTETAPHQLFVGTRMYSSGANASFVLDSQPAVNANLNLSGEDVLIRFPLGTVQPGTHTLTCTNSGPAGNAFYFDFLEIAYPSANLPDFPSQSQLALATDWDTYHSQALPAERTAWLVNKLGYQGRLNHYAGALWFYEIVRPGTVYAAANISFTTDFINSAPVLGLTLAASSDSPATLIAHTVLPDDTPATVALAFAGLINLGTNLVWASVNGGRLTLTAQAMGTDGNGIVAQLGSTTDGQTLATVLTSVSLSGGVDGTPYDANDTDPLYITLTNTADYWRTDLSATPRLNRAARDWHQAYFAALKGYGIEAVTSFSMELMNGDPSSAAGIAQQYPDGTPVALDTPSLQTNFSPTSLAFWSQAYIDMATLQSAAGLTPYLQFGEVQWWYNPKPNVGMPFYDAYTTQQFQAQYGVPMQVITNNTVSPSQYPNETAFLPGLIGQFTAAVRKAVLTQFPTCRFEVLYPTDTNDTPLNQVINYPNSDWTLANLNCLKTESFSFTAANNLDQSAYSFGVSVAKGFPNAQRSHLVGISNAWTSWMKEVDLAQAAGLESVVLFALDQYCLIGYPPPPFVQLTRSQRQG